MIGRALAAALVLGCAEPAPWFRDVTSASGVAVGHVPQGGALPLLRASGFAVGDLDGDGRHDLIVAPGGAPPRVYRNRGGLRFEDATAASGLDPGPGWTGAALADLDGDGDLDLLLSSDAARPDGRNLRWFEARGGFVEGAGLEVRGAVTQVLPLDLDGDGALDLYVACAGFDLGARMEDRLFLRRGGGFVDASAALPAGRRGFTWAAAALDADRDGDLDLWIGNDTFVVDPGTRPGAQPFLDVAPDQLLENGGLEGGVPRLRDVMAASGAAEPRATMGVLAADFTGDGIDDVFVSDYGRDELWAGRGDGTFEDRTAALGLEATHVAGCATDACLLVSWGAALEDLDQDGRRDLVVLRGRPAADGAQPVGLFRGTGAGFAPAEPGLPPMNGRALVPADLDGDGDLDLVAGTWGGSVRVLENVGARGGAITVRLRGRPGARVRASIDGRTDEVMVGAGGLVYASRPLEAHFGLGAAREARVEVVWPGGRVHDAGLVGAGSVVAIEE